MLRITIALATFALFAVPVIVHTGYVWSEVVSKLLPALGN
jgi:hypothetical protein